MAVKKINLISVSTTGKTTSVVYYNTETEQIVSAPTEVGVVGGIETTCAIAC